MRLILANQVNLELEARDMAIAAARDKLVAATGSRRAEIEGDVNENLTAERKSTARIRVSRATSSLSIRAARGGVSSVARRCWQ